MSSGGTHWLSVKAGADANDLSVGISDEGSELLRGIPHALSFVMIFGPARQGKSFFMNAMMNQNEFQVSNSSEPCTQGVHLSNTSAPLQDFMPGAVTDPEQPISVGFIDVEGSGDKSGKYDLVLTTPILMSSKIVFFNWMGGIQKNDILERLAVLSNAASKIERASRSNVFGHLNVLLRDFTNDERDAQALIFSEEDPNDAEDDAMEEQMRKHNNIRKHLQNSFSSIKVWAVPPPAENFSSTAEMSVATTHSTFQDKITAIKQSIAKQLQSPHTLQGQILTGPVIANMVPQIVKSLEEGASTLSPPSIIEEVHKQEANAGISKALASFKQSVAPLLQTTDADAMDETSFGRRLDELAAAEVQKFEQSLSMLLLDEEKKQAKVKQLGERLDAPIRDAVHQNTVKLNHLERFRREEAESRLLEEVKEHNAKKEEHAAEVSARQQVEQALAAEQARLQETQSKLESETQEHNAKKEEHAAEVSARQQVEQALAAEQARLQETQSKLESETQEHNAKKEEHAAEVSARQQVEQALAAEQARLQETQSKLESETQEHNAKKEEHAAEVSARQQAEQALAAEQARLQETQSKLESETQEHNAKKEEHAAEVSARQQAEQVLAAEQARLQETQSKLESETQEHNAKKEEHAAEVSARQQAEQALAAEQARLQETQSKLESETQEHNAKKEEHAAEVSARQQVEQALAAEQARLQETQSKLESETQEHNAKKEEHAAEVSARQQVEQALAAERARLISAREQKDEAVAKHIADVAASRGAAEEHAAELASAAKAKADLEEQLAAALANGGQAGSEGEDGAGSQEALAKALQQVDTLKKDLAKAKAEASVEQLSAGGTGTAAVEAGTAEQTGLKVAVGIIVVLIAVVIPIIRKFDL